MSKVATNIDRIIRDRCLKQSLVAVKAGFQVKAFNDMLRGRKIIKADDIPQIAVALGVEPNDIYFYEAQGHP